MKFIIALLLVTGIRANAAQEFRCNGKPCTKLEATKQLLANPGSDVIKSCNAEVTDKMTLRCKKAPQKTAAN